MFARTKPQCADILYGDDDVCEFIVNNMRFASYVTSLILAARGKRELALRVYDDQSIRNSQSLLFGCILGRDEQLIAVSKCNVRSIAVKAACFLGDEKLTNHYIESDAFIDGAGYNILESAAVGGNIALVKQFMHGRTECICCCNVAIDMYLRTRDTKYINILKFIATKMPIGNIMVNWCYADVLLINTLIDIGYNFSTLEVRCIVSSCTVDIVKQILQVTNISDVSNIIRSAASRADILAIVLNNPNTRIAMLTNDDILNAISVAVDAKNITNVKLLAQLLSDCETV